MKSDEHNIPQTAAIGGKRTRLSQRGHRALCVCIALFAAAAVVGAILLCYRLGLLGGVYGIHRYNSDYYNVADIAAEQLSVHFLQLSDSNGDCVYIKAGDTDVLIDAGAEYAGVVAAQQYIDRFCTDGVLEYVIVSHGDRDHYAGFVGSAGVKGIFDRYDCRNIIQFARTNSAGEDFLQYCAARDRAIERGANFYTALDCCNGNHGAQKVYRLSDSVTMEVLYQRYYEQYSSEENNYSVCLLFRQGSYSYLFTGDLQQAGENALLESNPQLSDVTLYKAAHHGSASSSQEALLQRIRPQYVCVCCIAGSVEYTQQAVGTFPAQSLLDRLAPYTDRVYVTNYARVSRDENGRGTNVQYSALNGDIVFACTDGNISMYFSHSDSKLVDTEWFRDNRTLPSDWSGV